MKKKNTLTVCLAVALACAVIAGGGTYAYLQSETDDVVNSFKANQVTVALEETKGNQYDIIPGTTQGKDPKVTVKTSVPAFVFVEITDTTQGLVKYEIADGWSALTDFGKPVYYRSVDASDEAQVFGILKDDAVYYDAAVSNGDMLDEGGALKDGLELSFKAYAIQKYSGTYSNGSYRNFSSADAYVLSNTDKVMEVNSKSRAITAMKYGKDVILGGDMQTLKLTNSTSNGQNVSIDLNGHTVSPAIMDGAAVLIENDDADKPTAITVIGDGTVSGKNSGGIRIAVQCSGAGAYIVLDGGTYVNENSENSLIYAENGGHITINGGTFKNNDPIWTLNTQDNSGSVIEVRGGSFFEYDPSNSSTEPGGPVSFVADGYKVVSEEKADGTWYTVVPEA